jgi:hypothetical protein
LIYIAFFLEVGLLLMVLPWSAFWDRNYFVAGWVLVREVATNNFVRGAVTGLGLVNLGAALSELASLIAARDDRRTSVGDRQSLT